MQKTLRAALHLMVTGVKSIMVVTLSRKADRMAAIRHRMMIIGHTLPRDSWYACTHDPQVKQSVL